MEEELLSLSITKMTLNPLGFQQISDWGNPKYLTGEAREVISGGQIVGVSGAEGVVTSGTASYVNSDIKFYVCDDASNAVGVALNTVASGAALAVAVDGVFLLPCGGSVLAGRIVEVVPSTDTVQSIGSTSIPSALYAVGMVGNLFGKAYTAGASGGFAVINLGI
jgi:predicted RecA/RadA family phage recombinase